MAHHPNRIVGAYYPDKPEVSGVAPGCQIISIKIGDSRLGTMETTPSLIRGFTYAALSGCDLANLSYGEPAVVHGSGRLVELLNQLADETVPC